MFTLDQNHTFRFCTVFLSFYKHTNSRTADFSNFDIHFTMEKKYCPPWEKTHKCTSPFPEQESIIQSFPNLAVKVFLLFCLLCSRMSALAREIDIYVQQGKSPSPTAQLSNS